VLTDVDASSLEMVRDELEAIQLPPPQRRRRIRLDANASLRDSAALMARLGRPVAPETVRQWERGVQPRRAHAVAYRHLLDAMAKAAQ
jgi:hypothetical protein